MPELDVSIIDGYRRLLDLSRQLFSSAQSKEWAQSIELERQRAIVLQALRILPPVSEAGLDEREQREIAQVIEAILQCDDQTASLIRAEMSDLRELLGSVANERKLSESYM